MKVCFVCYANICRSYLAQELLRKLAAEGGRRDIEVFSRGIFAQSYFTVPAKIKLFLMQCGIEPKEHIPTFVSKQDMQEADLILAMTKEQTEYLRDNFAQFSDKIFLFMGYALGLDEDMKDPVGIEGGGFQKIAAKIKSAVEKIYPKL